MAILSKKEVENLVSALNMDNKKQLKDDYKSPALREISQEQMDEIHNDGKITPYEWLEEMEQNYFDLCPFSNESSRCLTFKDCHDCLVDYANAHESFFLFLMEIR